MSRPKPWPWAHTTVAETGIVLEARLRRDARGLLLQLLDEWRVATLPFGEDHWREAIDAYARFGRGRHRAALNFGDCLSYAVARLAGQPLLCVGDDFAKTDLPLALPWFNSNRKDSKAPRTRI